MGEVDRQAHRPSDVRSALAAPRLEFVLGRARRSLKSAGVIGCAVLIVGLASCGGTSADNSGAASDSDRQASIFADGTRICLDSTVPGLTAKQFDQHGNQLKDDSGRLNEANLSTGICANSESTLGLLDAPTGVHVYDASGNKFMRLEATNGVKGVCLTVFKLPSNLFEYQEQCAEVNGELTFENFIPGYTVSAKRLQDTDRKRFDVRIS